MNQLQKSNLLRLRRRYTPRNDRKDAICLCERVSRSPEGNEGEAIPLLNAFAITCYYNRRLSLSMLSPLR